LAETLVYPTYHPSYLNYAKSDSNVLDALYQDLERAFNRTKPGKQVAFTQVDEDRKKYKTLVLDTESELGKAESIRCTGYAEPLGPIRITKGQPPIPTKKLICHFARHDYVALRRAELIPEDWDGEIEDTILLCQMLDENREDYSLKSFAQEFGYSFYWRDVHSQWEQKLEPEEEILHPYCATDVALTRDLYVSRRATLHYYPRIMRNYEFLSRQIKLLGEVELNGLAIRSDAVKALRSLKSRVRSRERWIRETYDLGLEVKVSGKAKSEILFGRLGLPVLKKTRKLQVPKADKHVLAELAQLDSTGTAKRYQVLSHIKAQEKDIAKLAVAAGGLLHPKFNLGGRGSKELAHGSSPVTGRLSSQEPNMQNVPDWARCYVVSRYPKGRILKVDAKQIEMRVAYEYSKDSDLIVGDPHQSMTDVLNAMGILVENRKHKLKRLVFTRDQGKMTNFAAIYGAEEPILMERLGIPYDIAREVRAGIREHYHRHFDWIKEFIEEGKKTGEAHSLSGHVRRLPLLKYSDKHAINQAVNHPIQNFANVLNLCAAAFFGPRPQRSLLINLVHDECVYDCENELVAEDLAHALKSYWKTTLPSDVKRYFSYELTTEYQVEVSIGENWGETLKVA
jgi:DNA polymerase-1